jgi:hypothetical protein
MQAVVDMCRQNVTCEKKGGPFFLPQTPVSQGLAALEKVCCIILVFNQTIIYYSQKN